MGVITREDDNLILNTEVLDLITDHHLIKCKLSTSKPALHTKTISARKLRSVDMDAFKADILASIMCTSEDVSNLVDSYNSTLSSILDKHAPLKSMSVTVRPTIPFYTDAIHNAKLSRRKAERKWRKSRSPEDLNLFRSERSNYNSQLFEAKCNYFRNKIVESGNDSKALMRTLREITQTVQRVWQVDSRISSLTRSPRSVKVYWNGTVFLILQLTRNM